MRSYLRHVKPDIKEKAQQVGCTSTGRVVVVVVVYQHW